MTFALSLTLFAGGALPAYAAANIPILDPNFSIVPKECTACPCNYYGLLQLVQNLVNAGVAIGIIAFTLALVYVGASIMLNPTNPEMRSKARSMLLNIVIGLIIVLAAWLVVDFIMKIVYDPKAIVTGSESFGPWNEILSGNDEKWCIEQSEHSPISGILGGLAGLSAGGGSNGGGGSGGGGSAGGTCVVRTTGPCAAEKMTAFGAAAANASKICSAESCNGGCQQGDKTTKGYPVSFGLFQINITAHPVNGLNCPKAFDSVFTGSHKNVEIIDPRLYEQCKAAALTPAANIAVAASIYTHDGDFGQWSTHRTCGIAFDGRGHLALATCRPLH
jgi:hypothetical protein